MRAKLILLLFTTMVELECHALTANPTNMLEKATDLATVQAWANAQPGTFKTEEITVGKKKLLAVHSDSGSGTTRITTHLFVYEKKAYHLLLVRRTNSGHVDVIPNSKKNGVLLRSKAGKTLAEVSLDSMNIFFDPLEQ